MFSEHALQECLHPGGPASGGGGLPQEEGWVDTPIMTSGGGHFSGRYASYWNASLF